MADMTIGIIGCAGRMGRMLLAEVHGTRGCALGGGVEAPGHTAIGEDLGVLGGVGAIGLAAGADDRALFGACDAVIEFSTPEATAAHAAMAAGNGAIHVIGTTGLSTDQEARLAESGAAARIVYAPNMSMGVNLLMRLTERAAAALDPDYDIEIVEMHHRHKVDAPSGTALGLGRAAAAGREVDLEAVAVRGRDGVTGARPRGAIGFAALRGGDVVGDHTVVFAAEGERIELTHRASSRRIYARGAVRAALWARGRAPGVYSMADVLGI